MVKKKRLWAVRSPLIFYGELKVSKAKRAAWLGSWDDVPGGMMTGCWGGTGALCDALFC